MEIARSVSITGLAESAGYTLQRRGSWHILKEAQHVVIKPNNRYFDGYKREWGDGITFLQNYRNMSFPEAVEYLLEFKGQARDKSAQQQQSADHQKKKAPVAFVLPERNEDDRKVFSYLRKRGIAYQVIENFVKAGLLYESKQYHNCVFVGKDSADKAVFATMRGTYEKDGVGFKGDVEGGNKDYAFRLPCDPEIDRVRVYEAPIDLMSDMTLRRFITSNSVALCCLHDGALETYLKENPHIKTIDLCLDNDKWGREVAERMKEKYAERGFTVNDYVPPKGKDWNEYLQTKNARKKERSDLR